MTNYSSEIPTMNNLMGQFPELRDQSILHMYRGSKAHNMFVPSTDPNSIDDIDTMSFVVPNQDYYFGLSQYGSQGTREIWREPWDIVVYEARKAIRLLAQGNPNVVAALWLPDNMYIHRSEAGQLLLDNRDLFVGKHVYHSFAGYANAQLQKLEKGAYRGYLGEKRKQLVDKFGYDPKNACHLIRLLVMCNEFLDTGKLIVYRADDAEMFLSIKRGEWKLEEIKYEAQKLFYTAKTKHKHSKLPEKPDLSKINELCCQVVRMQLGI